MSAHENWKTPAFRQSVASKIDEVIQWSGLQVARNSIEMENHIFMKAKTQEEYMSMVAKLILHVRDRAQAKLKQTNIQAQSVRLTPALRSKL